MQITGLHPKWVVKMSLPSTCQKLRLSRKEKLQGYDLDDENHPFNSTEKVFQKINSFFICLFWKQTNLVQIGHSWVSFLCSKHNRGVDGGERGKFCLCDRIHVIANNIWPLWSPFSDFPAFPSPAFWEPVPSTSRWKEGHSIACSSDELSLVPTKLTSKRAQLSFPVIALTRETKWTKAICSWMWLSLLWAPDLLISSCELAYALGCTHQQQLRPCEQTFPLPFFLCSLSCGWAQACCQADKLLNGSSAQTSCPYLSRVNQLSIPNSPPPSIPTWFLFSFPTLVPGRTHCHFSTRAHGSVYYFLTQTGCRCTHHSPLCVFDPLDSSDTSSVWFSVLPSSRTTVPFFVLLLLSHHTR